MLRVYNAGAYGAFCRDKAWTLRDRRAARRGRDGRSVSSAGHARLDRTVAIKVLASHLSNTPELRQRFEREARSISALNHAHICQLFDVGSQAGADYLVMEFLAGETLAERLRRGPLPLTELLKTAMEVAEALAVAHRAGIIHRDLKPGNIMLTKSGAKLMDFGFGQACLGWGFQFGNRSTFVRSAND